MIHYSISQRDLAALRPKLLNRQQYADNENNQSIKIENSQLTLFFLYFCFFVGYIRISRYGRFLIKFREKIQAK